MDLESSLPAVKKFVNMLYAHSFDQVKRKHSSACVSGIGERWGGGRLPLRKFVMKVLMDALYCVHTLDVLIFYLITLAGIHSPCDCASVYC